MKLPDITAWLASERDFTQGAALYAALGPSATYKRLFALPATDYAQQVLARELASLVPADSPAVSPTLPVPVPTVAPPALKPPAVPTPADSPLLTHLHRELKAVRDLRSHIHPQLTAKGMRRTERQKVAGTIVALTDKEGELKATLAYVQEHGRLPGPVPTVEVTDAGELRRRLQNLLSQRAKLKKRPDRAAELAAAEEEITLIRSKLATQSNV